MFIVFVCNMFTFQKFGISSLHIGELHSHMRGGGGGTWGSKYAPRVSSAKHNLSCDNLSPPSPSFPPPHVPIKYGLSKHFMPDRFLSPGEGSFCFQRNAGRRRLINVEINEGILHPATICKYRVKFMLSTFINLGSDMSKYWVLETLLQLPPNPLLRNSDN